ncbi:MAG TPA: cytochrome P450 [Acidimicrobiales bacterium]|nr:cytochrome P450 [Acidimicrobiales bacterium]
MPPTIDVLDREFWNDAHEAWTWCRANDPVYRDEAAGIWCITKHADILWVERHDELFSSDSSYRLNESPGESNMIASDDPVHLHQRRLVNRGFTPRAAKAQTAMFVAMIDALVDPLTPTGRTEVIQDIAGQLPARFTAQLLGLDADEWWPTMKQWSERLMRIDAAAIDQSVIADLMTTLQELGGFVATKSEEFRGCPADGLLSTWANATMADGTPMPIETIFHETGLFISGGSETTRTAIAHGLRAFCDHTDQWDLLFEHPEHLATAVDEVIRWVTPLNNMFRKATEDVELRGKQIKAGDRLALVYPSANRDEDVFTNPFAFDVARSPNNHVAFGYGTHFCIGANIARLELELLFSKLTRAWTNLRVITEPDVELNHFARAVRSFELGFDARP